MKKIKLLAVRAAILIMKLIYLPMKALPVGKKVVMISRQSDTPSIDMKLLREKILEKHPDYEVVILAKMLKNPVIYVFHILIQMYHIATSQTVILDSYCIPVSVLDHRESLTVIQMWHSMGSMKKFGYAMLHMGEGWDSDLSEIMRMHHHYDYILISSMSYLNDYIEGFHTEAEKVREIPQPRADLLTDASYMAKVRNRLEKTRPWLAAKKNILYCPTFRKEITELDRQKVRELINSVDYKKYNLIYKPHSVSEFRIQDPRVIISDMNIVEALAVADVVISDYSSIIYEAGLCHIPVYLYMYDWEEYSERRALNLDYKKDIPAFHAKDGEEILKAVEADAFEPKAFDSFVQKNIVMPETSCCEEIMKLAGL